MKCYIGLILCLISFSSCSVNSWDIERYKNKFETHKIDFETLVNLLKTQNVRVNYFINENDLPENIRSLLDDLNISNVNLNTIQCKGLVEYQFESTWSRKATLYFSKSYCDKEQTIKGYHANESEMIEVWGMGDGWSMWIDHYFY